LDSKGIDIDAIKDWIKQSTEALLNQQELRNYLREQRKARDDINEEMLQEGDRFTELMVQKERLELEREQIIEEGSTDEVRLLEIEAELNDVVIESDSIDQTLDTLEEHYRYVSDKITQLND
jgi:chromosome segregation ATPase